jgi:hypothetical protein
MHFPDIVIALAAIQNGEFGFRVISVNDYKTNRGGIGRIDAKSSTAFMQGYAERGFLR